MPVAEAIVRDGGSINVVDLKEEENGFDYKYIGEGGKVLRAGLYGAFKYQ